MIAGSVFATWGVGMFLGLVLSVVLAAGAVIGQALGKRWNR